MSSKESTLEEFPLVPSAGKTTVAEYGAQLVSIISHPNSPPDAREFSDKLLEYHRIDGENLKPVLPYKIPSIRTADYRDNLIIHQDEGVLKGMWDSFMESGWRGLEKFLERAERNSATTTIHTLLKAVSSVTDGLYKLKHDTAVLFFPHLGMDSHELIEQSSQIRGWQKSWTKAVVWHPQFPKLAVALKDDTIRIFTTGEEIIPMLRSVDQKDVSCIAFRPFTDRELAVGVSNGILIWHMNSPISIKPGSCQTQFLSVPNHAPVTSVEYSSSGLLLLSSSSHDTTVYIWDVTTFEKTPLRRVGGGGVPLALWSPHEDKILTTSPSSVFRIWNRENRWAPRRWTTPSQSVEAARWSPNSSSLLFASEGILYAIHFALSEIDKFINESDCVAIPVFDVSATTVPSEDGKLEYKVGGRVRNLDFDPTGNRVAVFFDDSELIAVFRVQPRSSYYLAPCGFIRGFPDEFPVAVTFQKDFEDGALLTIAWNSGRMQYFPLLFALAGGKKNLLHQDHYKTPNIVRQKMSSQASAPMRSPGNESGAASGDFLETSFRSSSFSAPLPPHEFGDFEFVRGNEEKEAESPRLFSLQSSSP